MLTKEYLQELFEYKDGSLYWRKSKGRIVAGTKAGCIHTPSKNYTCHVIRINNKLYKAHRLIYMYFNGYTTERIDHKDNNPLNNNIDNLRLASQSENTLNKSMMSSNTSGVKGVSWRRKSKKWTVRVTVDGEYKSFGSYADLELAELVAIEARNKYHKEFANHGDKQ